MIESLNYLLEPFNIKCSEKQLNQFNIYYEQLIDYNKKTNLTNITDLNEVVIKHFFDSITPAFYYNFTSQKIIDVGTGAGFPSIPLKILFPKIEITLLDSLVKRVTFLELISHELNLDKVTIIHGRAEEIARANQYREVYDIAISRAVARLNVLSELALPFIKKGGFFVALKGAKASEEVIEAKTAIKILGGEIFKEHSFQLPNNSGERVIIFIKKIKHTPLKYPRKPGDPNRKPIN